MTQVWPCHKLIVMSRGQFALDSLVAFFTDEGLPFPLSDARVVIAQTVRDLLELIAHGSISHVRSY